MFHRQVIAFRFAILLLTCLSLELPLLQSQVSSSKVAVAPRMASGTVASDPSALPSGGSQAVPPPNGQSPDNLSDLRKMISDELDDISRTLGEVPRESDRMCELKLLLAFSEYMIYGGHEESNCRKLVHWIPQIFGQGSSLCRLLTGSISKNLHAKFQSQVYQGFFRKKSLFSPMKAHLPSDFLDHPNVVGLERQSVLEIARGLPSIIDGGSPLDQLVGHLRYLISVWPTYGAILEGIPQDALDELLKDLQEGLSKGNLVKTAKENFAVDIPENTFDETAKDTLEDTLADIPQENGTSKGGLLGLVQKHPKYSAAGVVGTFALGGIGVALWNYFKSSSTHQSATPWKNETLIPAFTSVTSHEEAQVEVPLLLAVTCFLVGVGALLYACTSYCSAHSNGNVQQAEGKEPTQATAKKSEKKSKMSFKSAKTSASTASMATSSPATEQTAQLEESLEATRHPKAW